MTNSLSVADAKKHFSELMSRVAYKKERLLIDRRGKPLAASVPAEDLVRLEQEPVAAHGLLAAVGACADFDDWDVMIKDIYRQRYQAEDRPLSLGE